MNNITQREKLEHERQRVLRETTKEQRIEQATNLINVLDEFGKTYFNSKINLFLDDLRSYPEGFKIARNVNEAIWFMDNYRINILSLDHDLGENEPTGYDLTKWMVENEVWAEKIYLHTSNPVGRANMYQLLDRYKPEHVRLYRSPMPHYNLNTGELLDY